MRRSVMMLLLGVALSGLAFAQAPSLSNLAPDGYVPGPPGGADGNGSCPCLAGTPEGEANCGLPTDDFNGGCNSVPEAYSSIAIGETVCGTAGVDDTLPMATRDTDWYAFTVTQAGTYAWQVEAEFAAAVYIVDMNSGCGGPVVIAFDTTTGCGDTGIASLDLTPGDYAFFVAPNFFSPSLACGSEYTASLYGPQLIQAIPTVGRLGLGAIALALGALAFFLLRRRRATTV